MDYHAHPALGIHCSICGRRVIDHRDKSTYTEFTSARNLLKSAAIDVKDDS